MPSLSHPLRFLLVAIAGWIHQQQRDVIDYLHEENRVLREQLGPRRLRFTDDQCVRLAAKARKLPRQVLQDIVSVVTPDTPLAWHRHVIARKYDGHQRLEHEPNGTVSAYASGCPACLPRRIPSERPPEQFDRL